MSATIVLASLVVVLSTTAFIIYSRGLKTQEANMVVWLGSFVLGASCLAGYLPVAADPLLTAQYAVSALGCGFVCVRLVRARAYKLPESTEWGTVVAAAVAAGFVGLDSLGWVPLEGLALNRARVLVPGIAALLVSFPLCLAAWRDDKTRYPWLLWSLGNIAGAANIAESNGLTCAILLYVAFAVQNAWIACGWRIGTAARWAFTAIPLPWPRVSGASPYWRRGRHKV